MPSRIALVIVDPQNDFGTPEGNLYVPKGEEVVQEIGVLRLAFLMQNPKLVITRDWHPADHMSFYTNNPGTKPFDKITLADGKEQVMWPPHCVQMAHGAAILTGLHHSRDDLIIDKGTNPLVDSYSGFGSEDGVSEVTPLHNELQAGGITHLVVCGLAYEYCVAYTAKDAAKLGYKVCVLKSATRGISEVGSNAQEALMLAAGIYVANSISEVLAWSSA